MPGHAMSNTIMHCSKIPKCLKSYDKCREFVIILCLEMSGSKYNNM